MFYYKIYLGKQKERKRKLWEKQLVGLKEPS